MPLGGQCLLKAASHHGHSPLYFSFNWTARRAPTCNPYAIGSWSFLPFSFFPSSQRRGRKKRPQTEARSGMVSRGRESHTKIDSCRPFVSCLPLCVGGKKKTRHVDFGDTRAPAQYGLSVDRCRVIEKKIKRQRRMAPLSLVEKIVSERERAHDIFPFRFGRVLRLWACESPRCAHCQQMGAASTGQCSPAYGHFGSVSLPLPFRAALLCALWERADRMGNKKEKANAF